MQKSLFFAKSLRKTKLIQSGFLSFLSFKLSKKLHSSAFKIPIIRNMGWNNIFDNEPWMSQILEKMLFKKKGSFIDVGANIGQTLLKVKSVFPDVKYYGFEANPVCLFYLNELINANNLKATFIIPIGLSDNSGLASLNFFSKNSDDATASVVEQIRPDAMIEKKEFVYLTRLDDLIQNFEENIAIIKIDVEGAELDVIKGATAIIRKHRPVILIEILPSYSISNTWRVARQMELEKLLKVLEYKIILIAKDKNNNLLSFKHIDEIGITSNILERDYILIPNDELSLIKVL
jgi:FkbM family methyltransferase